MSVFVEPFASVYDGRSRLGVILARVARLRDLCRGRPKPETVSEPTQSRCRDHHDARPWIVQTTAENKPERNQQLSSG
jgi:hypothetical protein